MPSGAETHRFIRANIFNLAAGGAAVLLGAVSYIMDRAKGPAGPEDQLTLFQSQPIQSSVQLGTGSPQARILMKSPTSGRSGRNEPAPNPQMAWRNAKWEPAGSEQREAPQAKVEKVKTEGVAVPKSGETGKGGILGEIGRAHV